ncbi:ornithine carbamoyltransferase [Methanocalculus sp.]|uniref:ornithine carbamoyltransferase n=1 Tax=Methanocalculus sp. TaxID=2004547 RepID=UPI00271B2ABD|nr:ornithine carbamoyltransferase [Methanocalculus sp.]MDO8841880.1 ornithine carbamoyltransferase [Methanocalculus sp.]
MKQTILSILDLTSEEISTIIRNAIRLKDERKRGIPHRHLEGKTLGMIFEKSSTRTRISFEVGMYELGGSAVYLNPKDMQLDRGEAVQDTARVLSRYLSSVMIRAHTHTSIQAFSAASSIPVINGLSDKEHPCQILADLMTLQERFGTLSGIRVAWIGDGNNVCNSLILSTIRTGMKVSVSVPPGYEPDAECVHRAEEDGYVTFHATPEEAVAGADAIYTDTWISMGDEDERAERMVAFESYRLDEPLLKLASKDAIALHCLPAHRGSEITDAVIDGPQSAVWDQAENRLHAQKALLIALFGLEEKIR